MGDLILEKYAGHECDVLQAARDKYLGAHVEEEDETDVEWYRQELMHLYSEFNPSKLKDVNRMLGKCEGREEELLTMVRSKYLPGFRLPRSHQSVLKTRQEVEAGSEAAASKKASTTVGGHDLNAQELLASTDKDGSKVARRGGAKTKAKMKGRTKN